MHFPTRAAIGKGAVATSTHLQWTVPRNSSSFLIETNKQTFSTDPNNLKAPNSFNDNRLIHLYTVGEKPGADGRRIVVATKRRSLQGKPTSPVDHHEQERLGHPRKHRAQDPQEPGPPRSVRGRHSHSRRHPSPPEACDGEEEEARPTKSS
ncbi:60s ribosomal protein l28 [Lynx pardinus]|uniref:Large ribosomal subunit protein eL28 n=1 Tax=Lynx pardinus TaxID=191816 RepID=A0A485MF26_LYNPA|nr:60s ribosomal protein l28 [Lynx pardinus]